MESTKFWHYRGKKEIIIIKKLEEVHTLSWKPLSPKYMNAIPTFKMWRDDSKVEEFLKKDWIMG